MNIIEALKDRVSKSQQEKQAILQEERELRKKIAKIQTFPGTLDEFNQLTGKQYELVPSLDKQIQLRGARLKWQVIDTEFDPDNPDTPRLHLPHWGIGLKVEIYYSEIKAQAVRLNATALIHYKQERGLVSPQVVEYGLPVRLKESLSK